MKVTYWSDFACPYCYIGETNFKKALEELGLEDTELIMKAYELNPAASREETDNTIDRFSKKYNLTKEEATRRVESINEMSKEAGLDFDYKKARYTNTSDAHRLLKYAQNIDQKLADLLAEKLYEAYFKEEKVLADHDTLMEIAESVGLDPLEIRKFLGTIELRDQVMMDELEAVQVGVKGVPFFVIDERIAIPGAVPVNQLKEILQDIINEQ